MAVGVNTCPRGCGCSTFPRTRARSLASPQQAKARHDWHSKAWFGRVCLCLIICVSFWRPFPPKSELDIPVKLSVHVCVGHGLIMVDQKIGAVGFNFEKEGPVWMVVGLNTYPRGRGCSTFCHTCACSLTSPRQAKASHSWHGIHVYTCVQYGLFL